MKLKIAIDQNQKELLVLLKKDKIDDEVNEVINKLSEQTTQMITGFCDDSVKIIDQTKILRAYSQDGKVFVDTDDEKFTVRLRLYELEQRLCKNSFVRISNSEIINLKKVKSFDLSFTGTICVVFNDGSTSFASRRYVSKIKQVLGI